MREFVVNLRKGYEGFVEAFNEGLIRVVGGEWNGRSWDAFNDYLSWAEEEEFRLKLCGAPIEKCLASADLKIFGEILQDNPHVYVSLSPSR